MTKEWVNKKNEEHRIKTSVMKYELADKVRKLGFVSEDIIQDFLDELTRIEEIKNDSSLSYTEALDMIYSTNPLKSINQLIFSNFDYKIINGFRMVSQLNEEVDIFRNRLFYNSPYERYLDSDAVKFDGTIIITDPCYIRKDDEDNWDISLWGLSSYLTHSTIYGDWSCTTFNSDTNEVLGEFCADGAEVGVFLLDDVLKYNPKFDYHENRKWTTTTIKNFFGTVQIIVEEEVFDDGDREYNVHVVGKGKDAKTGKALNFITRQTGL